MNLYLQLGLIIVITWYLFYYKEKLKFSRLILNIIFYGERNRFINTSWR